jgi:hypothetical protein
MLVDSDWKTSKTPLVAVLGLNGAGAFTAILAAVASMHCGGAPEAATPVASASATALALAPRPALSGLPERRFVPPVGVLGSRSVKLVVSQPAEACARTVTVRTPASTPTDWATAAANACAAATKMKPFGTAFVGTATDKELGKEFSLALGAGQCVRFYVGAAPELRSITLGIRDSKGAQVFEDASEVVPKEGELCTGSAEQLTFTVGAGWGSGAFAVVATVR